MAARRSRAVIGLLGRGPAIGEVSTAARRRGARVGAVQPSSARAASRGARPGRRVPSPPERRPGTAGCRSRRTAAWCRRPAACAAVTTVAKTRSGSPCPRRQRCQARNHSASPVPGSGRAACAAGSVQRPPAQHHAAGADPGPGGDARPGSGSRRHAAPHVEPAPREVGESSSRVRGDLRAAPSAPGSPGRPGRPPGPAAGSAAPAGRRPSSCSSTGRPAAMPAPRAAPSWPRPGRRSRSRSAGRAGSGWWSRRRRSPRRRPRPPGGSSRGVRAQQPVGRRVAVEAVGEAGEREATARRRTG